MTYRARHVYWPGRAQEAEARGDWDDARRSWYYAAQECSDGDMRARYNKNEDEADKQRRCALEMQREADLRYSHSRCAACGRVWQNIDFGCALHQLTCDSVQSAERIAV